MTSFQPVIVCFFWALCGTICWVTFVGIERPQSRHPQSRMSKSLCEKVHQRCYFHSGASFPWIFFWSHDNKWFLFLLFILPKTFKACSRNSIYKRATNFVSHNGINRYLWPTRINHYNYAQILRVNLISILHFHLKIF